MDLDADGIIDTRTRFAYDGNQIVMQFDWALALAGACLLCAPEPLAYATFGPNAEPTSKFPTSFVGSRLRIHSAGMPITLLRTPGHLYQGRFKSFPIESDDHPYTVLRYVERNSVRANLTERAEAWRWSSAWRYYNGDDEARQLLADWPIPRPRDWRRRVNRAQTQGEVNALRRCVRRGQPYGTEAWCQQTIERLGLEWTIRPRGRPRKQDPKT